MATIAPSGGALAVRILDAEQKFAARAPGIEPIEQSRPRPTDVEIAGGRGREARDDGVAHGLVTTFSGIGEGLDGRLM